MVETTLFRKKWNFLNRVRSAPDAELSYQGVRTVPFPARTNDLSLHLTH